MTIRTTINNLYPIEETGYVELEGINDTAIAATLSYSNSAALPIAGGPHTGKIIGFSLISTMEGTGAVQDNDTGQVIFFDADPAISAGDVAMTAAEAKTVIGKVGIVATDWPTAAADLAQNVAYVNGRENAAGYRATDGLNIPFHNLSNIYAVFLNTGASTWNSAAADDETLGINVWYQRES